MKRTMDPNTILAACRSDRLLRIFLRFLCSAAFGLWANPLFAASELDRKDCQSSADPGTRIAACTRVVSDRGETFENRRNGYVARARVYARQGEFDKASADFDAAI